MTLTATDAQLEQRIVDARQALLSAPRDQRRDAWGRLVALLEQRSDLQVMQMEIERGLR